MKSFFAFLFLIGATPAVSALDIVCEKSINKSRTEYAHISTYPDLLVGRSFEECTNSGGTGKCGRGMLEKVADSFRVCGQVYDVANECSIWEDATHLTVRCPDGVLFQFEWSADGTGQMSCATGGVVRKSWSLGICKS